MLHPIEDGEVVGEDPIPPHVGALVDVHKNEESNEYLGEVEGDELAKECTKFYHIEGLAIVHETAEDF